MTDKDTFESPSPTKAGMFPAANKQSGEPSGRPNSYQSVTKLILPTAFWFVVVIFGLCFLGLLSSFNKNISTLRLEIEQANSRHNSNQNNQNQNQNKPQAERLHHHQQPSAPEGSAPSNGGEASKPFEHGWLSVPSWASLEPRTHKDKSAGPASLDDPMRMIDDILKSLGAQQAGQAGPVSGFTILASSSNPDDLAASGPAGSPIEAMLSQLLGEPDNKSGPNEPGQAGAAPLIAAHIDRLNVNINTNGREQSERELERERDDHPEQQVLLGRREREREEPRRDSREEQELMSSLDKSIDSLVSKLMFEQQMQPVHQGHHHHHQLPMLPLLPPPHEAGEPMLVRDQQEPGRPAHQPSKHHDHLPAPLSDLLGPIEGPAAFLLEPVNRPHHRPAMFGRPHMSPFHMLGLPSEGDGDHLLMANSNNRDRTSRLSFDRLAPSSPYELLVSDLAPQKPSNNQNTDALADDLANSLQTLFQAQENPMKGSGKKPSLRQEHQAAGPASQADSIVIINGDPLISDGKQSLGEDSKLSLPDGNQMGSLFKLFFGPPPSSSNKAQQVVVAAGGQEEPSQADKQAEESPSGATNTTSKAPAESNQLAETTATPNSAPSTREAQEIADHLVNDLLTTMFAMPQFGNDQRAPVRTDSQSGANLADVPISPVQLVGPEYIIEQIDE